MLEELLGLVGEGGLHCYDELAARLGVSRPLVEAMIHDLVRLGYLRPAVGACEDSPGCRTGCSKGGCGSIGVAPLWTLTDKGAQAALRSRSPSFSLFPGKRPQYSATRRGAGSG